MATTLEQYWTDEVTRLSARLAAQTLDGADQRTALAALQAVQRAASDALRSQGLAVEAARRALGTIAMPSDGDPLLLALESALVDQADAQAAVAMTDQLAQAVGTELARQQAEQAASAADLAEAQRALGAETRARAARQLQIDRLSSGDLAGLVAEATLLLGSFAADASDRVESEFPSSATNAKHFLKRVRARRALVDESLTAATAAVTAALTGSGVPALLLAQAAFDTAVAALRHATEAPPRLAADAVTLARLAALPAAAPPVYPILSRWQHERLFDATRKAEREAALAKLTDVDTARSAVRMAQQSYELALTAALKAEPDKTRAELDASTLSAEVATVASKQADLNSARAALSPAELTVVKTWFAAVPERLWEELDKLDGALARLNRLIGPPTPADLVSALTAAEAALTSALTAERLAQRGQAGAAAALQREQGALMAERETAVGRSRALARSAALF